MRPCIATPGRWTRPFSSRLKPFSDSGNRKPRRAKAGSTGNGADVFIPGHMGRFMNNNSNILEKVKSEMTIEAEKNTAQGIPEITFGLNIFKPDIFENIPLSAALERVQQGAYRTEVEKVRALLSDEPAYKTAKSELPFFSFSGLFRDRVKNENLVQHSGIICIDFDNIDNLKKLRTALCSDPYTAFLFVSPSGHGLKLGVRLPDTIQTTEDHNRAFLACEKYYAERYSVDADRACKDVRRACFVSYDPDLYGNPAAEIMPVPEPVQIAPVPSVPSVPLHIERQAIPNDADMKARQTYSMNHLTNACHKISTAPEGERHVTRRNQAARIGRLIGVKGLDRDAALQALITAALSNTQTPEDARKTVMDGFEKGLGQPDKWDDIKNSLPESPRKIRERVAPASSAGNHDEKAAPPAPNTPDKATTAPPESAEDRPQEEIPEVATVNEKIISNLPESPAFEIQRNGRYKIYPEEDQLQIVMAAVFEALDQYNTPPKIFRSETGDFLSEIIDGQARQITKDRLKYHLTHAMDWVKLVIQRKVTIEKPVEISSTIIGQIFSQPDRFPLLRRVIPCPVFSASGKLHFTPGYDPETGFFLPEQAAFNFNRVSVKDARETLLEWLIDFPFDSEASRANAIAAAITPFVRAIVGEKPVPRMFFTAPVAATGKGRLAGVLALPFLGEPLHPKTECRNDDELEKAIVSEFIGSTPDYIFFDNLVKGIVSPKLAAWATTYRASGRVLGSSQSVVFPVNAPVWLMTANNPTIDRDNARRSLNIRIDAGMEHPELRTDYKHENPEDYTLEHRQEIVSALLSLCLDWLDAGRPSPVKVPLLGSFEVWSSVVGGILEFTGFDAVMGNMRQFMEDCDEDTEAFRALLSELEIGRKYKAKDFMEIIKANGMESLLPDNPRGLANILKKRKGQIFTVHGVTLKFDVTSQSHGSKDWGIIRGTGKVGIKGGVLCTPPDTPPEKNKEKQYTGGVGGVGGVHKGKNQQDTERDIYKEEYTCVESGTGDTHLPHLPHLDTENIDKNEVGYEVGLGVNRLEPHLEPDCRNCIYKKPTLCMKQVRNFPVGWNQDFSPCEHFLPKAGGNGNGASRQ